MITKVTSRSNPVFRQCARLLQKKYRDREGKYLIEGVHLVSEAAAYGEKIETIIIKHGSRFDRDKGGGDWGRMTKEDRRTRDEDRLLRNLRNSGKICVFDKKLFDAVSETEMSQGILAVVRKKDFGRGQLKERIRPGGNIVVLDRLQDPGNIGTIIRTAEGAGYEAVISIRGTADIFSPKVVRAAAGALFRVPVCFVRDAGELVSFVEELGKKLTVTCVRDAQLYSEAELSRDIALVIGNEGNGCDPAILEQADIRVTIPMGGKLESLNASVAAGILMYESVRAGGGKPEGGA